MKIDKHVSYGYGSYRSSTEENLYGAWVIKYIPQQNDLHENSGRHGKNRIRDAWQDYEMFVRAKSLILTHGINIPFGI